MQRYKQEIAEESFKLVEGMQGLMAEKFLPETPPCDVDSSFTALLGLPANQAMELLHAPENIKPPEIAFAEIWSDKRNDQETLNYFNCTPTFPSNSDLVERASRLSIFAAAEYSPETNSVPSNSFENSLNMKNEPADSDSNLCSSQKFSDLKHLNERQRSTKRKGGREKKVHGSAKKSKIVENWSSNTGEVNKDGEKLPYVHVRARRGQATDSHSLAERARREKINARMKLLQELVPGCSKITGTALVLEEIINHVQALQRQVEFLSMRLATVNPRFDFSLDSILAMESGYTFAGSIPSMLAVEPRIWPETPVTEGRRQQHQNPHPQIGLLRSPASERENPHSFFTQENSLMS